MGQSGEVTPYTWLLKYMAAGIDCVAVTDHNTGAWIDRLRKRSVMIRADLVRAAALVAIPVLWWTGVLQVWHLCLVALVLGVASAVFLSEYSAPGPVSRVIRLAIINLAGVPSIVFGLFGLGMFVLFLKWNVSLMAGWFTLAFMVLPVIIFLSLQR